MLLGCLWFVEQVEDGMHLTTQWLQFDHVATDFNTLCLPTLVFGG